MAEDKYDKFRNKYCLENPKYNLIKKLSPFEASVAIFFIIGIPTEIIVREKSGIILAFIFAFFTFLYVKHLHKEFSKAWEKRFGDK